jgi:serine protease Do
LKAQPLLLSLFLMALQFLGLISPSSAGSNDLRKAMESVAAKLKPTLVRIHVIEAEYEGGRETKTEGFGSGVIITKEGHVITNHHVAGRAKRIVCTLADKTQLDAVLVGTDAQADIAVIKLLPEDKRTFPTAKFGDSSTLRVGDVVLAMGSPLAFSQSVTMGIVSNTELIIPKMFGKLELDGEDVGTVVRWIAHDAPIFPGNSGGPLVNMNGEVVGINEISLGLSGAIPSNLAREVADQIIKYGKVTRSWLGLSVQPLLRSLRLESGVLVGGVIPNSPADKAGFKPGDVILKLDGKEWSVRFEEEMPSFNYFVMGLPRDKVIEAVVLRNGEEIVLHVQPEDKEEAKAREYEFKEWGICGSNITRQTAMEMKRKSTDGVLVISLRSGGPAATAKPAIMENDVIVEVAGKPIKNVQDLKEVTSEITADKTEPVPTLVAFDRGDARLVTVVRVGIEELQDPGLEIKKAWLPVETQVFTEDIAKAMNLPDRTGVRITKVYPNSTAEKAGLKVGDVIVAVDEVPVQASQPEHADVFPAMIRQYSIGSTIELTILREGKEEKVSVQLVEAPKLVREMKKYKDENFDFIVRDIAFADRTSQRWSEDQAGLLVDSVSEGGWASLGGLSSGDLIMAVNGESVKDVESFERQMKVLYKSKPRMVVFWVKRGINDMYVEIEPSWED